MRFKLVELHLQRGWGLVPFVLHVFRKIDKRFGYLTSQIFEPNFISLRCLFDANRVDCRWLRFLTWRTWTVCQICIASVRERLRPGTSPTISTMRTISMAMFMFCELLWQKGLGGWLWSQAGTMWKLRSAVLRVAPEQDVPSFWGSWCWAVPLNPVWHFYASVLCWTLKLRYAKSG